MEDLKGQRIILKQKKLKLGKNKYEILYKDVASQSCVFNTCKNNKPYKIGIKYFFYYTCNLLRILNDNCCNNIFQLTLNPLARLW